MEQIFSENLYKIYTKIAQVQNEKSIFKGRTKFLVSILTLSNAPKVKTVNENPYTTLHWINHELNDCSHHPTHVANHHSRPKPQSDRKPRNFFFSSTSHFNYAAALAELKTVENENETRPHGDMNEPAQQLSPYQSGAYFLQCVCVEVVEATFS